jgi:adenylate cyclase
VIQAGKYILSPIQSLPLDASGNMMIRFFNEPEKYSSVSMIDVLNAKTPEELQKLQAFFSDKIVLIGEYGTLIHDDHFSPVDTRGKMPGVEFHANMLDGILQNRTLVGQSSVSVWITAILLAALLIGSFYIAGTWAAIITLVITIFSLIVIGRRLIT